jgi:hypothetical protein
MGIPFNYTPAIYKLQGKPMIQLEVRFCTILSLIFIIPMKPQVLMLNKMCLNDAYSKVQRKKIYLIRMI